MIRVAIIDDHEVVRMGLQLVLEQDPEFQITASGSSGLDAVSIARKAQADVLLLDLNMPEGMSGFEALERIVQSGCAIKVLVLSQHEELALIRRVLDGGAQGYLSKAASPDELKKAVRRAHQGKRYISADLAQKMSLEPDANSSPFTRLSQRELETVLALMQGESVGDIGKRLFISPKTVGTHKRRMMEKLQVENMPDLVRLAITHGVLPETVSLSDLQAKSVQLSKEEI